MWGLQGDRRQVGSVGQCALRVLESRQPEGPGLRHLLPVVSKVTNLAPDALHEGNPLPRRFGAATQLPSFQDTLPVPLAA